MRCPRLAVPLLALSTMGCAAAFRDTKPNVHFDADVPDAEVRIRNEAPRKMPVDVSVERGRTTVVVASKPGFNDHRGVVARRINPAWVVVDVITCVPALCIPLVVDAVSGAWFDVPKNYRAKLEPLAGGAIPLGVIAATTPPPPPALATTAVTPPPSHMSESERKATARAAYLEGVAMQERHNCEEALPRFAAAEKLFDAPTHLLHIAQCQVELGKLLEANETYETLARANLAANAPEAFRHAQETAKRDLPALKSRIPTLRVEIVPAPGTLSGLSVQVNGSAIPTELVGLARPVNPGKYRVTANAVGYKAATVEISLREGELKTADIKLTR